MAARPITLLTDYGYEDEFAGVCRAVIAGIAPGATVIDLGHGAAPGDVRGAAAMLADALPHCPPGVHLAIVDPGVGTERRPVAVRAASGDRVLVGPDNGLVWPALEALGGAVEAADLARSPFARDPVSATFHGRDLFAPVSARLALGAGLGEAGEPIDPASLARIEIPDATVEPDRIVAEVVRVDRFGNVSLGAPPDALGGDAATVEAGDRRLTAHVGRTFADVAEGGAVCYPDSSGRLALAVNRGSAAEALGVARGDRVTLRPSR